MQSESCSYAADIFSAHLLFLKDPQFIDRVEDCIQEDLLSQEAAVYLTIEKLAQILKAADNTYLREHVADIRELHRRLLRHTSPSGGGQLRHCQPIPFL